jgi:hypothetical protein
MVNLKLGMLIPELGMVNAKLGMLVPASRMVDPKLGMLVSDLRMINPKLRMLVPGSGLGGGSGGRAPAQPRIVTTMSDAEEVAACRSAATRRAGSPQPARETRRASSTAMPRPSRSLMIALRSPWISPRSPARN